MLKEFKGYFNGVNLGGWLSQCEYTKNHYDSYINENDIEKIANHGFDHVRLPIDYELIEDENGKIFDDGFVYIDSCLEWCKKYKLNMIIDLHKTRGYDFGDPESAYRFFNEKDLIDDFQMIWKAIATRYSDCDNVAFELLNEIVPFDVADAWNPIWKDTCNIIRSVALDNPIIVGGVCYNSANTVSLLDKPESANIVFNFHCYEPFKFTHQGAEWSEAITDPSARPAYPGSFDYYKMNISETVTNIVNKHNITSMGVPFFEALFEDAVDTASKYNIPLYCGEYGVIENADKESQANWMHDINTAFYNLGIGHAVWNYKGLSFEIEM